MKAGKHGKKQTAAWQAARAIWLKWWQTPWSRRLTVAGTVVIAAFLVVCSYYYVIFARQIDERLHGERERVLPRVFARPLELYEGEAVTDRQLIDRLNDLGYVQKSRPENAGEFSDADGIVTLIPRGGTHRGRLVRATFLSARPVRTSRRQPPRGAHNAAAALGTPQVQVIGPITRLEIVAPSTELRANSERSRTVGGRPVSRVTLESPLLSALIKTARQKRRQVPLSAVPTRMVQAVLAIEDRRFYSHLGVDPIGIVGALLTNLKGDRPYLVGASTLTQQLVKNFFLTPEKSIRRKLLEQVMALVLERRASKDEILELYLNEVYL